VEEFPDWLPGVVRADRVGTGGSGTLPPAGAAPPAGAVGAGGTTPAPPPAPGTEFQLVSSGPGGITVTALGRVEAIDPPRSITISATSGLFALTATCTVEALGPERSRVAVVAELQPRGLATFAAGRIEQELRAAAPDALERLRAAVEA
jgi:hypothetical protein